MNFKLLSLFAILLTACSDLGSINRYDGVYEALIDFNPSALTVRRERILIKGASLSYQALGIASSSGELKTTCQQFDDRVEFVGKDGITAILKPDGKGNLLFGSLVYERKIKLRETEMESAGNVAK